MRPILHLSMPTTPQRIEAIQLRICAKHKITLEELTGERRHKELVQARHEAIREVYYSTGASTPVIGRAFNRDHTSILWVVGRVKTNRKVPALPVPIKIRAEKTGF